MRAHLTLTARRDEDGLGLVLDKANFVTRLSGAAAADGLLDLGDEIVAVDLSK